MPVGGASPEAFVSALCIQNAALLRSGKSLALSSVMGNLGFPSVGKQMRRIFGYSGGAARQDVLAAADVDVSSDAETDFEAWAAYRTTKKKGEKK